MNKNKYIAMAALATMALPLYAQETYENARLATEDLNGTARYVGMGGAMEALGADISTIGTNPAGIGLFKHSSINTTFGLTSQINGHDFAGGNKTNASFDQIGGVYTMRTGRDSWMNFAFSYHKSRNFDQLFEVAGKLDGKSSQNKLTYDKWGTGVISGTDDVTYSQVDALYTNHLLAKTDANGNSTLYYYPANSYTLNRYNKGYIGNYDFNLSGNIHNRIFLGLTVGIKDVHYNGYTEYSESFVQNLENISGLTLADQRKITGTGFYLSGGAIFRPFADSPFRFGVYVITPTWYDLTTRNYTTLSDGTQSFPSGESYDFKLYTPWKFGFSLGHTIAKMVALGATYEYADYGSMDSRIKTGSYYDDWGYSYDETESDDVMNHDMDQKLKGVSTVKLGVEVKPIPCMAIRAGYNYVSPMYSGSAYKNGTLKSPGSYYASQTDYTNWKATNRLTLGLGYTAGNVSVDLAYQYNQTNGNFYPFMNYTDYSNANNSNYADAVKVKDKHQQVMLTVGYRF
jgi:hypothetical protein